MNNTRMMKVVAGALLLTGLAASAPVPIVAIARADTKPERHWCPGQRHDPPTGPGDVVWDWNVCHTFYSTNYGMGNVVNSYNGQISSIWDGDNPPIEAITIRHCPPIAFMCP
jgi:hypothetical protein